MRESHRSSQPWLGCCFQIMAARGGSSVYFKNVVVISWVCFSGWPHTCADMGSKNLIQWNMKQSKKQFTELGMGCEGRGLEVSRWWMNRQLRYQRQMPELGQKQIRQGHRTTCQTFCSSTVPKGHLYSADRELNRAKLTQVIWGPSQSWLNSLTTTYVGLATSHCLFLAHKTHSLQDWTHHIPRIIQVTSFFFLVLSKVIYWL